MNTYLNKPRKAFGDANGWVYRHTPFNLGQLVRNSSRKTKDEFWHPHDFWHTGFDHSEYYWLDKKPVAIATHPYPIANHRLLTLTNKWPRLRVHECPDRQASWYYPGRTLLFVVTRLDTSIVWPTPEEVQETTRSYLKHHPLEKKLSRA
jgi:hypothetical protein